MFCPLEPAWGDVATWLSAVATTAAVIVALVTAGKSGQIALQLQENERLEATGRDRVLQQQLIVAFDVELDMLISQLELILAKFRDRVSNGAVLEAHRIVHEYRPRAGLKLLSRFADDLRVFPVEVGAVLISILCRWELLLEAPEPDLSNLEGLLQVTTGVDGTFQGLMDDMGAARLLMRPLANKDLYLPDL